MCISAIKISLLVIYVRRLTFFTEESTLDYDDSTDVDENITTFRCNKFTTQKLCQK